MIGFLNSVYPAKCISCNNMFYFSWQNYICDECISDIKKDENLVYCHSCGAGVHNCQKCLKKRFFKDIKVYTSLSFRMKDLIYEYKLNKSRILSKILAEKIKEDFIFFMRENNIKMVLYVPLHKKVFIERGFNHLKEILEHILPSYMIFDGVKKIKHTEYQAKLSKDNREKNLKDAFVIEKSINAENVLVFDDVLTTGSTLMEMYKTVRKSGYNGNIYGYVITKS